MRDYAVALWAHGGPALRRSSYCSISGSSYDKGEDVGCAATVRDADHIWIDRLYIAPSHQRRGLGGAGAHLPNDQPMTPTICVTDAARPPSRRIRDARGLALPYPCRSIGASSALPSGRLISRSPTHFPGWPRWTPIRGRISGSQLLRQATILVGGKARSVFIFKRKQNLCQDHAAFSLSSGLSHSNCG